MQGLCDICQKVTEVKVIGGNTVCSQEVAESEWEQGLLFTDPAFVFPASHQEILRLDENGECFCHDPNPVIEETVGVCPDCERPNQFGELCQSCKDEQERMADDEAGRWQAEREGNGYPFGTIGAETRR